MLPPSSGTIERHSQQHQRHQHPETSRQPISAGATTSAGRAKNDWGSAWESGVARQWLWWGWEEAIRRRLGFAANA